MQPSKTASLQALVIDDQKTMRSVVRGLLRNVGITNVHEAESGQKALEMLNNPRLKVQPDFILCDLHMEKGGGIDFINHLRREKSPKLAQIPVVVLTGDDDPMMLDVAIQVGAADIVNKPCSAQDLAKSISKAVGFKVCRGCP